MKTKTKKIEVPKAGKSEALRIVIERALAKSDLTVIDFSQYNRHMELQVEMQNNQFVAEVSTHGTKTTPKYAMSKDMNTIIQYLAKRITKQSAMVLLDKVMK